MNKFKHRRALTRFRVSSHSLEIENGRHCKPKIPVDQRLCKCCTSQSIEDEVHFLIQCELYADLRQELLTKISGVCDNFKRQRPEDQFYSLMTSENSLIVSWLAKYVYDCMSKRKQFLTLQ